MMSSAFKEDIIITNTNTNQFNNNNYNNINEKYVFFNMTYKMILIKINYLIVI